jgi:hypothetical protein
MAVEITAAMVESAMRVLIPSPCLCAVREALDAALNPDPLPNDPLPVPPHFEEE